MRFVLSDYAKMLETLLKAGYEFIPFNCKKRPNRFIWLRHDIEVDPSYSLPLAKLEESLGIGATYFVNVSSMYYNPLSRINSKIIYELLVHGHRIGLHFNCNDMNHIDAYLLMDREAAILRKRFLCSIEVVSFMCHPVK